MTILQIKFSLIYTDNLDKIAEKYQDLVLDYHNTDNPCHSPDSTPKIDVRYLQSPDTGRDIIFEDRARRSL